MEKASKVIDILFLVVTILSLCEFIFVRGMFTWLISVFALLFIGIIEIIFCIKNKACYKAALVALVVIAICSGYFVVA